MASHEGAPFCGALHAFQIPTSTCATTGRDESLTSEGKTIRVGATDPATHEAARPHTSRSNCPRPGTDGMSRGVAGRQSTFPLEIDRLSWTSPCHHWSNQPRSPRGPLLLITSLGWDVQHADAAKASPKSTRRRSKSTAAVAVRHSCRWGLDRWRQSLRGEAAAEQGVEFPPCRTMKRVSENSPGGRLAELETAVGGPRPLIRAALISARAIIANMYVAMVRVLRRPAKVVNRSRTSRVRLNGAS